MGFAGLQSIDIEKLGMASRGAMLKSVHFLKEDSWAILISFKSVVIFDNFVLTTLLKEGLRCFLKMNGLYDLFSLL